MFQIMLISYKILEVYLNGGHYYITMLWNIIIIRVNMTRLD